ncbi:hypothetical protein PLICRDRAFT_112070 [Plicaturopsis crispa FD-325 SS-3]|nr:hypothetical protein PLICRDRAFT_112070 [Plicaturopsis crispa FD-325 SS-3]
MTTNVLDTLQDAIGSIFDQAQVSVANHRKNCVALYKLHTRANTVTKTIKNGASVKLVGEKAFGDAYLDMISRILPVKKGPAAADRVVKFIGAYMKFMNEKGVPKLAGSENKPQDEDDDTPASRFVARVLAWLLRAFTAKNKNIRFRGVSVVAEVIAYLGEIDEEMYTALRSGLVDRVYDKESLIRVHAIAALSKLVGSEDPSEFAQDEMSILDILLERLCNDPAPDVRRSALLHAPLTPSTLPILLTRTRDTDALTRKLVYTGILLSRIEHPRHLTIAQRELVVQDGLRDREVAVRVAAGKVLGAWFDIARSESDDTVTALAAFLRLFDVLGAGECIAVDALNSVFLTRAEVLNDVVFTDAFWKELTPESALLARVFVENCHAKSAQAVLEAACLPVVTAFAFQIQESYNTLLELSEEDETASLLGDTEVAEEERDKREEDIELGRFVLGELLLIALRLDFSDEIGRRKLFAVVRDIMSHEDLPESLIERYMDVLKAILPDEREFIRVVVEAIHELRDGAEGEPVEQTQSAGDETQADYTQSQSAIVKEKTRLLRSKQRHEMTAEEAHIADVIDIRCLTLCIGMLERVNGNFDDNSTLEGILGDLILPAVKRKELVMREKGLVSLGLCCLIAKNMALKSFQLFLGQVQSSPEELQIKVLQIVFDLLLVYDQEFFGRNEEIAERIIAFLLQTFENEESKMVQAVLCIGISKLLLSGLVVDPKVLTCLVMAYVSPATADNLELRQCLSYFFPVYCYSSPLNQSRMQLLFMTAYDLICQVHESLDDDEVMITPYQFGLLFISDWTNPQKLAATLENGVVNGVHVDLAIDILKALYESDRNEESRKTLLQLLGHLHIPDEVDIHSIIRVHILVSHLQEQCPLENPTSGKPLERFQARFNKQFGRDLRQCGDMGRYTDDEDIRSLYQYIGVDPPERCEAEGDTGDVVVVPEVDEVSPSALSKKEDEPVDSSEDEDAGHRCVLCYQLTRWFVTHVQLAYPHA